MQIPIDTPYQKRSLTLFVTTGVVTLVIASVVMLGWIFGLEGFRCVIPGCVAMKFNTALCFILASACFMMVIDQGNAANKLLFKTLTLLLALVPLVTILQDIFSFNAGIDQLFVVDHTPLSAQLPCPGRMSVTTSAAFILLALCFNGVRSKSLQYRTLVQYLFHFIALVTLVIILGWLLKAPYSPKFWFLSSMAVTTAILFCILSFMASVINEDIGLTGIFTGSGIGNIVARKLFPRMVLLLVALGYISIQFERRGYINDEFGVVLSTIAFLLVGLFLIWDTLIQMNQIDQQRTDAQNEMIAFNRNLENMVAQRTTDLKQSNERFIKILNSNPISIAITRIDNGHYVDINPALSQMLKYERDELIGHSAAELSIISAEYRQHMVDNLRTKGYIKDNNIVLRDKYGGERNCILSAEMLEYNNEKFMMSFVYDITHLKEAEQTLKTNKKELEILTDKLSHQNKQLLGFAHITSHNLRSPVSNLNLLLHFYEESTSEEDRADLWKNFATVVEHLNTTLNELLETLRIQEDIDKERETLSFAKTLDYTKKILVGQLMESKAIINADFSGAKDVVYPKMYLESIMMNLVSNSIKYRSPNRDCIIDIKTKNVNGQIWLEITDNGLGIDMARHANSLFGMRKTFHRHTEARGLGLFITKTQVEAMGGEISAESVVDAGTTFRIVFNKKN